MRVFVHRRLATHCNASRPCRRMRDASRPWYACSMGRLLVALLLALVAGFAAPPARALDEPAPQGAQGASRTELEARDGAPREERASQRRTTFVAVVAAVTV